MSWDLDAVRHQINVYAPYVGARIEVTHISDDGRELKVRMPLVEENANVVGVHFGGSLYAMVDPHLMLLLMHLLGPEYIVWDSAASIRFVRPGRGTVHATIRITDEELASIRSATTGGQKHYPEWTVEVLDENGEVVTSVRKKLYVRRRAEPTVEDDPSQRTASRSD